MTAGHFDQLIESSWRKRARSKGRLTLPVSVAFHMVVLAALVIVPLLSVDELPAPEAMAVRAFFVDAAPPPAPPPPPP